MEWFAPLPKRPQMGHDIDLEKQISKRSEANMKRDNKKGDVKVLGIDLAKTSYQLHGETDSGQVVVNKKYLSTRKCLYFGMTLSCNFANGNIYA